MVNLRILYGPHFPCGREFEGEELYTTLWGRLHLSSGILAFLVGTSGTLNRVFEVQNSAEEVKDG
jgi:hypothetical protein